MKPPEYWIYSNVDLNGHLTPSNIKTIQDDAREELLTQIQELKDKIKWMKETEFDY